MTPLQRLIQAQHRAMREDNAPAYRDPNVVAKKKPLTAGEIDAIARKSEEDVARRSREHSKRMDALADAAHQDCQRVLDKYPPIREHFTYTNVYGWYAPPVNNH